MNKSCSKLAEGAVTPIYIGPQNCEHVLGQNWRWTRDTAKRLGVPVLRVGGKPLISVAELVPALERDAGATQATALTDDEELEQMRASLGLVRIFERRAAG